MPELIPGGSSSGSGVAVGAGLVPLALGTDTAGSGRVPAGFNNIVGLKPSLGLISTYGVVPACRTLDCVSVFALTVDDAWTRARGHGRPRRERRLFAQPAARPRRRAAGAFSDRRAAAGPAAVLRRPRFRSGLRDGARARLQGSAAQIIEIDIEPFYETARLLYDGPWVAERTITARPLLASDPDAIYPVTREIILNGLRPTAIDTFQAFYKLEELRWIASHTFRGIDALASCRRRRPIYSVKQVARRPDPAQQPARHLHQFRQFARPVRARGADVDDAEGPAVRHHAARARRRRRHARRDRPRLPCRRPKLPLGALKEPQPALTAAPKSPQHGEMAVAVVGAHLSGLPLNGELRELGGRLLETTMTAADYRLYALEGAPPAKPGLLRVDDGKGAAIEIEIWALPIEAFGAFLDGVPPPMSIGTLKLEDGRSVKGFLAEAAATQGARDISSFGGWRAYLAQSKVPA